MGSGKTWIFNYFPEEKIVIISQRENPFRRESVVG